MNTKRTKLRTKSIRVDILSSVPESIADYASASILGRAQKNGLLSVRMHDIRAFGDGPRHTIDDRPFGGGPGMVMKAEPIQRALRSVRRKPKTRVILFSTRGPLFDEKAARRLAAYDQLILICGRYEGVDERVKYLADEEMSVGDFVLNGGEIPALAVTEAVARFIPGVLGKTESLEYRTHGRRRSYPAYTRPEEVTLTDRKKNRRRLRVPSVLLSGNHAAIEKWRETHE
ncbi:MAG: tRNA (guanosine(37)-N1)-methyltransferase TrmD [Candidatus Liptonbacteria bacterium]|nr:tRNA (guanosine(37)-N1)-methyltransferase TrmD [Candidatus Liptonbacteria bacterium]